jgi:nitrogen regulatory protein PII 1
MKMVRAIVRPEKEATITAALASAHVSGITKWDVTGHGNQRGVQVGSQVYEDLAKAMLMIVVPDEQVDTVLRVLDEQAFSGSPGDGKVFVTPVDSAYTVRTRKAEL